jgi:predicted metalloprotease with PDZ domain
VDEWEIPKSARKRAAKVTKPPHVFTTREGMEKRQHRLYLTVTESELRAVETRSQPNGFDKSTAWAVVLIRTTLQDQPQFGPREVDVLGESNFQLRAISGNLNQIAHACYFKI